VTGVLVTLRGLLPLLTILTCKVLPETGHIPFSGYGSPAVVKETAATLICENAVFNEENTIIKVSIFRNFICIILIVS
jgi:hypothetical protein